jgi:carboxypeptidase Taq
METQFNELKQRLAEVSDLNAIMSILGWDQEVMMPRAGTAGRAEQRATLSRVIHEKFTSPAVGQLLETLRPYEESQPYDSDAASLIRVTRGDYDKECRIPADLRAEMTRSASQAYGAWVEARQKADFALFAPHLEQQLALKRHYIACFPPAANPYDVLLDDFERGMTTAEVSAVFAALKADLVPLIRAISARGDAVSADCLHGYFPAAQQQAFCLEMLEPLGFSAASWRLDPTVHPFSTGAGILDRRITTRYHEDYVGAALFGALHECGHGLYEFGVSPTLERTPLCRGASYAMHESQSRLWENLVGRSRTF